MGYSLVGGVSDGSGVLWLITCFTFGLLILAVIWLELKRRDAPILKIGVAVCYGLSTFTSEALLMGGESSAATSPASPTKILPLLLCLLLVLHFRWDNAAAVTNGPAAWLILYLGWLVIAALISGHPLMSLGRCLQSILPAIIVVVVLRNGECGPWLCLGAISGIVSHVLIGVLAYPDYVGVEGKMRMSGFLTPNAFGFCSGITAVSGIALLSTGKWRIKGLVLAGLGVWGIKEGVARTAVLGVVISIIVVALVKRKDLAARSKRAAFIFRVGLGPVALGTLWTVVGNWDSLTKWFTTGNRATGSLTGRTEFWPNLLRGVASHPFFGFGPGALKVDGRLFGDDAFSRISQAHNSFVESLVAGGIPAGVFWVLLMISVYVQACRSMSEYRPIAIGVTAYLCVSSFTLGNMAGFGMGWFMLAGLVGWRVPMDAGVFRSSNRLVVDDIRGMSRGKLSNLRLGIGSVNSLS